MKEFHTDAEAPCQPRRPANSGPTNVRNFGDVYAVPPSRGAINRRAGTRHGCRWG